MNAITNPEAAAVAVESGPSPIRMLHAWLIAHLWSSTAYLASWTGGAICGVFFCAFAKTFLGGV